MLLFLELHAYLTNIDHNFLIRNRGTWRHSVAHRFYELDYFIGSLDMRRMAQHFRVQPYPFSDHLAKMGCFHLVTSKGKVWRGERFLKAQRYSAEPVLDLEAIRGPSAEAQNLRAQPRSNIDRTLQPLLPHIHFHPSGNEVSVHIFVEGSSFTEGHGIQQAVAGWGVWIPEANLTFHGPITTNENAELFLGADKHTNNTGELSAMVVALVWLWHSGFTGHAVIAYDSTYAANCTQGHWLPTSNVSLAVSAQQWLQRCQSRLAVSFRHVRSHAGQEDWWSVNNEVVDVAAKHGAQGQVQLFADAIQLLRAPPPLPEIPAKSWPELASLGHDALQACLPKRKPHQQAVPYTASALEELDRRKGRLLELQTAFHQARGTPSEPQLYEQVKVFKRSLQQWARRQRSQWIAHLCKKLDAALRLHDMRQFYHHLRALGVHIKGKSFEGSQPFGLETATTFVEKVGNEPFTLPHNIDDLLPPQAETAWDLDHTPSESEILGALGKMRDTKGGTDGITVGCIRAFGPWFQRLVAKAIQQLWQTQPETWDQIIHEVVGVLLFKKGARSDPANYRCTQLINVISRPLPKLLMAASSSSQNLAVYSPTNSMVSARTAQQLGRSCRCGS